MQSTIDQNIGCLQQWVSQESGGLQIFLFEFLDLVFIGDPTPGFV